MTDTGKHLTLPQVAATLNRQAAHQEITPILPQAVATLTVGNGVQPWMNVLSFGQRT